MPDITQKLILKSEYDSAGARAAGKDLDDLGQKAERSGSALGTVGKGLAIAGGIAGAGLLAGLTESVKVAANFEQALQGVAASTGATKDEMALLRASALQTGKDTALSASESIAAYGELAKAGVSVKDILAGAGRAVVDLAVSQGTTAEAMATIVSNSLNTFKTSLAPLGDAGVQAQHVADVLARTANASAIDVGQIAFSLAAVGPVASQAGLSMDDFATAIGLMGNHALVGADAGTSLKTMLISITAPTSTAAAAMDYLGFSAFDSNGKVKNFRDILGELQAKTKDMSDEERSGLYKQIFGTDAIRAANILVGEGTEGWDKFQKTLAEAPGVAEQGAIRMKSLNGQMEQLKGSLETVAINVGTKLLPALTSIATGATDVVNKIIDGDWKGAGKLILDGLGSAFDGIGTLLSSRDWGKTAAVVGAALAAGFRGATALTQTIATWLGDTIGAAFQWLSTRDWGRTLRFVGAGIVKGLSAAVNLVVDIGTWLGSVIGDAFAWLGDHWPDVTIGILTGGIGLALFEVGKRIDWSGLWAGLKDAVGSIPWADIWSGVQNVGAGAASIGLAIGSFLGDQFAAIDWGAVWGKTQNLGGKIVDGLRAAGDFSQAAQGWLGEQFSKVDWGNVFSTGGSLAKGLGTAVSDGLSGVQGALAAVQRQAGKDGGLAGAIKSDLVGGFSDLLDRLKPSQAALDALGAAFGRLGASFGPLLESLSRAGSGILELFRPLEPVIKPVAEALGGIALVALDLQLKLAKFLIPSVNDVIDIFTHMISTITDVIRFHTDLLNFVVDIFTGKWAKAWDDAKNVVGDAFSFVNDLFIGWPAKLAGYLGDVFGVVSTGFGAVWTETKRIWGDISDAVTGAGHGIWSWFNDAWTDVTRVVLWPFHEAARLLGDAKSGAGGLLGDLFSGITGSFHAIWAWFAGEWSDVSRVVMAPFEWVRDHIGDVLKAAGNFLLAPVRTVLDDLDTFVGGIVKAVDWVSSHLGLGDVIAQQGRYMPSIPALAAGTGHWPGGWAMVGEAGPELAYLPQGARVVPNHETRQIVASGALGQHVPGFLFGLDFGDIIDALKKAGAEVVSFAHEWLAKGAGALLDHALDAAGVRGLNLPGVFADIGTAAWGKLKASILDGLGELLGIVKKTVTPDVPAGGLANTDEITAWIKAAMSQTGIGVPVWIPALLWMVAHESSPPGNVYSHGKDPNDPAGSPASDPMGLMQVKQYNFPRGFTEAQMFDPVTNISYGLQRIASAWGSPANIPGILGTGGYQGYAQGGTISELILGMGVSGRRYAFGERGPERITPLAGGWWGGGGNAGGTGNTDEDTAKAAALLQTIATNTEPLKRNFDGKPLAEITANTAPLKRALDGKFGIEIAGVSHTFSAGLLPVAVKTFDEQAGPIAVHLKSLEGVTGGTQLSASQFAAFAKEIGFPEAPGSPLAVARGAGNIIPFLLGLMDKAGYTGLPGAAGDPAAAQRYQELTRQAGAPVDVNLINFEETMGPALATISAASVETAYWAKYGFSLGGGTPLGGTSFTDSQQQNAQTAIANKVRGGTTAAGETTSTGSTIDQILQDILAGEPSVPGVAYAAKVRLPLPPAFTASTPPRDWAAERIFQNIYDEWANYGRNYKEAVDALVTAGLSQAKAMHDVDGWIAGLGQSTQALTAAQDQARVTQLQADANAGKLSAVQLALSGAMGQVLSITGSDLVPALSELVGTVSQNAGFRRGQGDNNFSFYTGAGGASGALSYFDRFHDPSSPSGWLRGYAPITSGTGYGRQGGDAGKSVADLIYAATAMDAFLNNRPFTGIGGGNPVIRPIGPAQIPVGTTINMAPGAVVIPASDLAEMQSVSDFFGRIEQVARARGGGM